MTDNGGNSHIKLEEDTTEDGLPGLGYRSKGSAQIRIPTPSISVYLQCVLKK
jgi:hypothetical protein